MPFLDSGLMCRKHAQDFLRTINVKNITEFESFSQEWTTLAKAKRAGSRKLGELIDQITDGADEKRCAEIESACDAIQVLMEDVSSEMDYRTEIADRSPRSNDLDLRNHPIVDMKGQPREIHLAADGITWVSSTRAESESYALRSDQSLAEWAQTRCDNSYSDLSLGRYMRSMICGASNDTEHRALSEGTDSAGGFTVPTILASQLIDRLRASSVTVRAGARTIPLESDSQSIARLASDPVPAFRAENAAIAESDPTFESVTLTPRSLAVMTKISRELYEDSLNLETELPRILATAMAKEMDRICLLGSGTAPEPRGVANQSGIGTTALNGALTSYSPLITAETSILTSNAGPVSAIIGHPREFGDLASLTDTTNQALRKPSALDGIPMLATTAIPVNGGSGSDESTLFVGNFNHLLIGIRSGVRVEVLRERYADTHQYGLVAHMRFDVAVQHAAAFHTITGVQS